MLPYFRHLETTFLPRQQSLPLPKVTEEMGLQQVLWLLLLTFSTCGEALVKTMGESVAELTYHYDAKVDTENIMENFQIPRPLTNDDGQQETPPNSTAEFKNMIHDSSHQVINLAPAAMKVENFVPRERGREKESLKTLKPQNARKVTMMSEDEASSLGQMLAAVVKAELRECDLVVVYDTGYSDLVLLHHLLLLHNTRQVVYVKTTQDLTKIIWTSSKCRGYFFLLDDPEPLLTFATTYQDTWDYGGRYVLVAPSLQYLEGFIDSYIGRRTEKVVGVVKSDTEGEWVLYMNQLYWGPGARRINTWYHHRFTRQVELFPDKLADFQGAVLKASSFNYEPVTFLHRAENGTVLLRYGVVIEVVQAIARVLNISLKIIETPNDETWGEKMGNGSWYGVMGQLQRQEVDIGLANLFITSHWLQVADLTAPYRSEAMLFMTRTEPPLPHWQALAFPFHQWTWLAVLVGLIISGPLLFLLAWSSGRCVGEVPILQDLTFAWYYAFGMHFCEAHKSLPRSTSTQIFVLFLWLYTMLLTISYSASLKAFLLVKKQPAMMDTFQDLHESGLEVAGVVERYKYEFALSSNPHLQGLTKVFKYYDNQEKVFPSLLEGKCVYLVNQFTWDYLIKNRFTKRGVSRVRLMKEHYMTYSVGMGLQRHSPLKTKFDEIMGWIQQSGLVNKFLLQSLQLEASLKKADGGVEGSGSSQEDVAEADGVIPLSIDHMQGLFFITCFGWLSGVISFIFEKLILTD
ncbi:ionotropic receptor 21a-like [Panulirus ornatus]|uniref:ionotropic receptor 21a-like n=1 Tax=Panulirus ornatus TaxID=150431 RepID=UPI003A86D21B